MKRGVVYGAAAYGLWGLFPIYFKLIAHVPALEVLSHRIVWSFITLCALLLAAHQRRLLAPGVPSRVYGAYAVAAALIGINWYVYVWAVSSGFIVETSLGYFITPLVNVLLGVVVFRETLRRGQWIAVGLAAAGVLYLTAAYRSLPWISLLLAATFGSYGLVKKRVPLGSVHGLTIETGVLFLPALAGLIVFQVRGAGAFLHASLLSDALLVASGIVTIGPLLLFASAVRRVPLSIVGVLQYIAPTLQFLLGVFVYREPFARPELVGFVFVWAALVVFTAESAAARYRAGASAASTV